MLQYLKFSENSLAFCQLCFYSVFADRWGCWDDLISIFPKAVAAKGRRVIQGAQPTTEHITCADVVVLRNSKQIIQWQIESVTLKLVWGNRMKDALMLWYFEKTALRNWKAQSFFFRTESGNANERNPETACQWKESWKSWKSTRTQSLVDLSNPVHGRSFCTYMWWPMLPEDTWETACWTNTAFKLHCAR